MKPFALLVALAVLLIGCARQSEISGIEKLVSTEKATWGGQSGTAVTIWLKMGTKELQGASRVGLALVHPALSDNPDVFFQVSDFTLPIMKVEPQTVTLFFSGEGDHVLVDHLGAELRAGNIALHPCVPNRVC
jgi:hypothetical protein